jgi:hypothetical protein
MRTFLVACSGLCLAAPAGAVQSRGDAPGLTVNRAVVHARWKEGWLRPGADVRVTGRVGAASHLRASLRPLARQRVVTARADIDVPRGGTFSARLTLPPRPLPGRYRLQVWGKSGKTVLGPVTRTVTVASPPEGVVGRALVSTTRDGPWLRYEEKAPVLEGAHNELWMRFVFLSPPRDQNVEVVWKRGWRVVVRRLHRAYASTIDTYARAGTALPGGVWNVVLRVDGRVAKQMAVRLRSPSPSPQPAITFG